MIRGTSFTRLCSKTTHTKLTKRSWVRGQCWSKLGTHLHWSADMLRSSMPEMIGVGSRTKVAAPGGESDRRGLDSSVRAKATAKKDGGQFVRRAVPVYDLGREPRAGDRRRRRRRAAAAAACRARHPALARQAPARPVALHDAAARTRSRAHSQRGVRG